MAIDSKYVLAGAIVVGALIYGQTHRYSYSQVNYSGVTKLVIRNDALTGNRCATFALFKEDLLQAGILRCSRR